MDWIENINWEQLLLDTGFILLKLIGTLIVFYIVRAIGKRFIRNSFSKAQVKKKMSAGRTKTLQSLTISTFSYALLFVTLVVVLGIFDINATGLVAGAGVVGLAIGFGAQGLVSDVVTGFFLLLEKQVDVGDYVTAAGYDGVVEDVGLRTMQIRSFDGTLNYVPNREVTSLSNHTRGNMQALVDIVIPYSDNIDEAVGIIQTVCDEMKEMNSKIVEGPNVIGVQTFDTAAVTLRVIAKTEMMEQWAIERDLRKAIKEALDANQDDPEKTYAEQPQG
ncbi:putative MscS family protein YkuT [Oceanobacillus oncorhynchi subsp. incaldanensis]|uniref:Putative MscS family protein YkuT n=1 Tax=Oceanobacillus oncorhynchi TaxID=545501 RepID=A0A0A1MVC3_9BACI|nr:mechanosensitive ion channel family protein [Oceanobacillus oncorhynchi]UUI41888.1 mechanosensitive ion channel family protein [Oceanobacillus oncorhynchi]GIO19940.1 putative MscS family protein YkuT [Oceanobacillus oncorhynchi subsp. incaldanensis]CEI83392.1 putative MscS family protein YkuT [Oceanobacillus oncorhynchi]